MKTFSYLYNVDSEVGRQYIPNIIDRIAENVQQKNKHEKRLGILKIISYLYKNQKQVLKRSLKY